MRAGAFEIIKPDIVATVHHYAVTAGNAGAARDLNIVGLIPLATEGDDELVNCARLFCGGIVRNK
jgi:hypothetical protein